MAQSNQSWGYFIRITAMPTENGAYRLHVCPGGGYETFKENQFFQLMDVALSEIEKRNLTIESISISVRRPANLKEAIEKWKAANSG